MRIGFVGSVEFSYHCLQEVLKQRGYVVAVLTLPPERANRHSDYAELEPLASANAIPTYYVEQMQAPETPDLIRFLKPDVLFVFGCSQLIPPAILALPPLGCIGAHPTLLPHNRGRHPLIWSLVEGLEESGLTFFYMDEGADSGDILWQKPFAITLEDDAKTLYEKIKTLASDAIADFLPQLEQGTAPRMRQDHTQATYWRKRTEKDGEIDWAASALRVYNLIRALTHPYPGAHTFLKGQRITIWKSHLVTTHGSHPANIPGTIIERTACGFLVQCGEGSLEIVQYTTPDVVGLRVGEQLGSTGL